MKNKILAFLQELADRIFAVFLSASVGLMMIFPAIFGGVIGGCCGAYAYNDLDNIRRDDLRDYASAVSNRLDKIEFGLSLLAIPVQPKENNQ